MIFTEGGCYVQYDHQALSNLLYSRRKSCQSYRRTINEWEIQSPDTRDGCAMKALKH